MRLQFTEYPNPNYLSVRVDGVPMATLRWGWSEPMGRSHESDEGLVVTGPRRVDALEEFFRVYAKNIALLINGEIGPSEKYSVPRHAEIVFSEPTMDGYVLMAHGDETLAIYTKSRGAVHARIVHENAQKIAQFVEKALPT